MRRSPRTGRNLDRAVRAADPARLPAGPELDPAMAALLAALPAEPATSVRPARRRPRARRALVVAVGMAVALAGTAAAVRLAGTHTGTTLPPREIPAGGPGEVLRMDAPDFPAEIDRLTAVVAFPPGYGAQRRLALRINLSPTPDASVTLGAARGYMADAAACAWTDAWVVAESRGDRIAMAASAEALRALLASPWVRALDPRPAPDGETGDDGRPRATRFGWLPGLAATVASGDRGAVVRAVRDAHRCMPGLAPHIHGDGR